MAKNKNTQNIVETVKPVSIAEIKTNEAVGNGELISVPKDLRNPQVKKFAAERDLEISITKGRTGGWKATAQTIRTIQDAWNSGEIAKPGTLRPRKATEFARIFETDFYTRPNVEVNLDTRIQFGNFRMVALPQIFVAIDEPVFENLHLEKGEGLVSQLAEVLRDEFFRRVSDFDTTARVRIVEASEKIANLPEEPKGKRGRPANVSALRKQGIEDYETGRANFVSLGFDLPAAPSTTEGEEWNEFETEHPLIAAAISKGAINSSTLGVILQAYR